MQNSTSDFPAAGSKAVQPEPTNPPLALPAPIPYEVRTRKGIDGQITFVGHDGRGEPLIEIRVPERCANADMVYQIVAWCRRNESKDAAPQLRVI